MYLPYPTEGIVFFCFHPLHSGNWRSFSSFFFFFKLSTLYIATLQNSWVIQWVCVWQVRVLLHLLPDNQLSLPTQTLFKHKKFLQKTGWLLLNICCQNKISSNLAWLILFSVLKRWWPSDRVCSRLSLIRQYTGGPCKGKSFFGMSDFKYENSIKWMSPNFANLGSEKYGSFNFKKIFYCITLSHQLGFEQNN